MVKLATNAMSTVELVKTALSIPASDTSYDDYLTMLINYASSWIESLTGRRFGLEGYTQDISGSGQQELVLKHYPIRCVLCIRDKHTGLELPSEDYSFVEDGDIGVIYRDSGWAVRAYPHGLVPDYIHTQRYLQVMYTAGYVLPKDVADKTPTDWILPADLQGIINQIAAQELALQENGAAGLSAFGISDVSWTFDKTPRESWTAILETYKRVV